MNFATMKHLIFDWDTDKTPRSRFEIDGESVNCTEFVIHKLGGSRPEVIIVNNSKPVIDIKAPMLCNVRAAATDDSAAITPAEFARRMREIERLKHEFNGDSMRARQVKMQLILDVLSALGYGEGVTLFKQAEVL